MELKLVDLIVFLVFFLFVVSFALLKGKRKSTSEEYFLAGHSLTWPLIGISIVAANLSTEQFVGMAGQGAGSVGLAVSAWQLTGSVGIVLVAFTILPRFLRAGIYTMPEFLEYRYNASARALMALTTVVIYVGVLVTTVLYSGGLTLRTIFDLPLHWGIVFIALIATVYTFWGGLKAVAWADLFQGTALLAGGILIFFLGLRACGGWHIFVQVNADRLHMILPASHEQLPWTGVVSGMWIVILYYCGLNQFIVQRNLAARTLRDGQLGVIFAGALWLLVPFAVVMPGIMANQLYGDQMVRPDEAYPMLIKNLVPFGLRGFIFAATAGAVISSLASMLNSASTIFTMDLYRQFLNREASQTGLVWLGRSMTVVFVLIGGFLAPMLDDPSFGGVFQFVQQYQGYIWPGTVAVFVIAFLSKRTPGSAGVAALISGPIIYGALQSFAPEIHFLVQVAMAFAMVCGLMLLFRLAAPLKEARRLPVRQFMGVQTEPLVYLMGSLVIASVIVFVILFR
jgi:SSS family solute:Na+ symporter